MDALLKALGPAGGVVGGLFHRMGIVEEELKAAKLPKKLDSLVFKYACPSPVLRAKGDELYRAHVHELIARVAKFTPGWHERDMLNATDAECLAAFSETSFRSPLNSAGQVVMEYLFARVFPERAAEVLRGDVQRRKKLEPYHREVLNEARRKLRREEP